MRVLEQIGYYFCATIILILLGFGYYFICSKVDRIVWNNGICSQCQEGHYHFINGGGYGSRYYYQCDNCDYVISFATCPQHK